MRYAEFRDSIRAELQRHPTGLTWAELREQLSLPYTRPCPEWVIRLEAEIGLLRARARGAAHVWTLAPES